MGNQGEFTHRKKALVSIEIYNINANWKSLLPCLLPVIKI